MGDYVRDYDIEKENLLDTVWRPSSRDSLS